MAEVAAVQPATVSMAHAPSGASPSNKPATHDGEFASLLDRGTGTASGARADASGARTGVPPPPAGSQQGQAQEPAANGTTPEPQNAASLIRKYSVLTGAGLIPSSGDVQNPDAPSQLGNAAGASRTGRKSGSADQTDASSLAGAQAQLFAALQLAASTGQGSAQGGASGNPAGAGSANGAAAPGASQAVLLAQAGTNTAGSALPGLRPPLPAQSGGAQTGQAVSAPTGPLSPSAASSTGSVTVLGVQTHLPPEALPASQLAQNPAGQVERSNQDQASSSSSDEPAAAIIRATGTGAAAISNATQAPGRGGSAGGGSPGGSGSGRQQAPLAQALADSQAVSGAAVSQGLGLSQASPSQQIFQAIQSEMPASAASQIAAQASLPGTYQPVKNLTIALDPPGLGSVAVELSYKGGELGVKVEASQAGTAQLLQRDGGALAQLLQTAGFTVANVSVHAAASPATPDAAAQQPGGGQQFSGAFTSSGGGGGAQPGAGQNQSQPRSQGEPSGLGGSQKESGYGRPETNAGGQSLYV